MLLFVNIFKIFKKSQKISSICRFLKFSKNAPIYEHFLNLIFGQKSKKKKNNNIIYIKKFLDAVIISKIVLQNTN